MWGQEFRCSFPLYTGIRTECYQYIATKMAIITGCCASPTSQSAPDDNIVCVAAIDRKAGNVVLWQGCWLVGGQVANTSSLALLLLWCSGLFQGYNGCNVTPPPDQPPNNSFFLGSENTSMGSTN